MNRTLKIILNIIIAIILTFLIVKIFNIDTYFLKKIYPLKYSQYVESYSKKYNIDKYLIYSIIRAESNFDEKATSRTEAKGLMQIMNETAIEINESLDVNILFDPKTNIEIGTKYYKFLYDYYNGNMLLAITAYNAGIGNVNKWIDEKIVNKSGSNLESIPFKETNIYVRKILNNYKMYKKLYEN